MIKLAVLIVCLFLGLGNAFDVNDCPRNLSKDQYLQYHNGMCYEFVVYARRTFWDANKYCKRKGGSLVIIKTKELNDFIWRQLYFGYGVRTGTWIGLADVNQESKFIWADGTNSKYYFTNWGYNQGPNKIQTYLTYNENCAAIIPAGGAWHDLDCHSHFLFGYMSSERYVCQYESKTTVTKATKTTNALKTMTPTTELPRTMEPTTITSMLSMAPITMNPTTMALTTKNPTTMAQTTKNPTTMNPTTMPLTTMAQTTKNPTTKNPTTMNPTTMALSTPKPTCPPFICSLDCGMDGYMENDAGCSVCECDV